MAKSKKKLASSNLTDFEKLAGVILLIIYLIILPFFGGQINNGINTLLGLSLSRTLFNTICFYILFAVVVLVFHSLIGKSTAAFIKGMDRNFRTLGTALVFFYGLNEILYRISHLLWNNGTNLNDAALINDLSAAPPLTALALVFFIPVIEEILFRGLVFGWLREHSRTAAYVISCLLFAILHAWQFAQFHVDLYQLLLLVQYIVPGFILTWAYDRSGSLWTSIGVHAAVNALAVWTFWW